MRTLGASAARGLLGTTRMVRMNPRLLLVAASVLASQALAQDAPTLPAEPHVRRVVVEDDGARIEELRVRGVTTRITVQPKRTNAAAYEIIPLDPAARDDLYGPRGSRGAGGQRVWNVFSF